MNKKKKEVQLIASRSSSVVMGALGFVQKKENKKKGRDSLSFLVKPDQIDSNSLKEKGHSNNLFARVQDCFHTIYFDKKS